MYFSVALIACAEIQNKCKSINRYIYIFLYIYFKTYIRLNIKA